MLCAGAIPLSNHFDGFSKAQGNRLWSSSDLHDERDRKTKVQGNNHFSSSSQRAITKPAILRLLS